MPVTRQLNKDALGWASAANNRLDQNRNRPNNLFEQIKIWFRSTKRCAITTKPYDTLKGGPKPSSHQFLARDGLGVLTAPLDRK